MGAFIDRAYFKAHFPKSLGKLTSTRLAGCEAMFDAWDALPHFDYLDWLAYAMATAWHETGATMAPVRESFAKTDADAVKNVTDYCKKAGIPNYAARNSDGNSYYGRGYVQLTHAANYKKLGQKLGMGDALYNSPDLVMEPETAAKIQPIFITVDPQRDTPAVIKTYVAAFHPKLIGLTGTPEQIEAVKKAFVVVAGKEGDQKASQDYLVNHTRTPFLFGPDGKPIALIPVDDLGNPEQASAQAVRDFLAQYVR